MISVLLLMMLLPHPLRQVSTGERTVRTITQRMFSETGELVLGGNWRYHPGDDIAWADPEFDDKDWEMIGTQLPPGELPQEGWPGIGWFRLHIAADSALHDKNLLVMIYQAGTADIYVDGELTLYSSRSGSTNDREAASHRMISLIDTTVHVLAVRYFNDSYEEFHDASLIAGYVIWIQTPESLTVISPLRNEEELQIQTFLTTLALTFALLHFILYWFSPDLKTNLFFSLFALLFAGNIFFDYQITLSLSPLERLTMLRIHRALQPSGPIAALLFVYSVFNTRLSWRFWLIAGGLIITGFFAVQKPIEYLGFVSIFGLFAAIEAVTKIIGGIRRKTEGAWIIATGFVLLFLFSSYDGLMDIGLIDPVGGIQNGYTFGFIGLLICMSVYLARDFAHQKKKIVDHERRAREQEVEQRILAADNARKTRELEDARHLQLSMLPKEIPVFPHLQIAVDMKPATEVGGDYYDFYTQPDGALMIAIGDATGHGARAGTMVTITKSLFRQLAGGDDLPQIFEKYTEAIKLLHLERLYMALSLVRIRDRAMTLSSAGMPPVFLYRAAGGSVEEIILKGMPLGCFSGVPYQTARINLEVGDTVVLMSDGLPEVFNPESDILGYPRVKELIREHGHLTPGRIIDHLKEAGELWADGRPQEDDLTFVVVRITQ